jgi:hypothetical protein
MTGLKVGIQFANLASLYADEGNTIAASRNLRAAQKAYEEFLRFLPTAKLTASQREQVARDLPQLKDSLDTLRNRLKIDLAQPRG